MSIHIYADMDPSKPATPTSGSDVMSLTSTAICSPSGSPGLRNGNSNQAEDITHPIRGWPEFARKIARTPAFEAFPTFTDLDVKCLLYYQAKLISLRKKLHEAECNDFFNGDSLHSNFAEDLEYLIECEDSPEQRKLIEEIGTVLDKYNTLLIQFSKVAEFPDADSFNVECLRNLAKKMCSNGSGLQGPGSQIWGTTGTSAAGEKKKSFWKLLLGLFIGLFKIQEEEREPVDKEFQEHLIVPRLGSKTDALTLWVVHSFIPLFHYLWGYCGSPTWRGLWGKLQNRLSACQLPRFHQDTKEKRESNASTTDTAVSGSSNVSHIGENNLTTYSKNWIFRVTSILTTIVACLLPVIAIIVLSRVHTMGMILGLIALFNTVFAFGLVLISSGSSRVEIFTATAAFSAVMVVFVQNKISQN